MSRAAMVALGALGALAAGVAGCADHRPGLSGTQSLGVELVAPADPGAIDRRLPDAARAVTINLTAYDAAFNVDETFDRDVEVYAQFLGAVTPTPTLSRLDGRVATPLARFHLTAGKAMNQSVALPTVFGPTTLWIEDGPQGAPGGAIDPSYAPSYASGTSPALWFRDPFVSEIQTPVDETAPAALDGSPLNHKQIAVSASRHGEVGRLVVTSVFADGYTVSDVACGDSTGAPPCTAAAYDHVEVFSRSAPRDQVGRPLQQGQVIDGLAGGVSEVDGRTEIGSPATVVGNLDLDPRRLPAPVTLDPATWFQPLPSPDGVINFERNEAGAIEVDGAAVCALDGDFTAFRRWKIDPLGAGGDCSGNRNVVDVVTAGVIEDLDPAALVGKRLPRIVGILRPAEIGSLHVWILFPRSSADLTLP